MQLHLEIEIKINAKEIRVRINGMDDIWAY